ncbi:MAG TPA: tyrosine-type recombinase/integrase [Verrucomicrobiae bacterium]|jgi:integrase
MNAENTKSTRQFKPAGRYLLQHTRSKTFYFFKWTKGAPLRKSLQTSNREQAELLRDRHLKELATRERAAAVDPVFATAATFSELAATYLKKVNESRELKPSSKQFIVECVKTIERTLPSWRRKVSDITPLECVDWGDKLRTRYAGPRFNGILSAFRKILDRAVLAGVLTENPGRHIQRAAVNTKRGEPPSAELFARLIDTLGHQGWGRNVRAAKVVQFLAYTGLRINEARQLLKTDLHLREPFAENDPDQTYGRIVVRAEITKRDAHDVPIFKECRPIIDQWLHDPTRGRHLMPVRECYRALRSAREKLGIPKLSHHDFRHLFATRCVECGVDRGVVAKWLGHRNAILLNKVYGHVRDAHKLSEARKVNFSMPSNVGVDAGGRK